MKFKPPSSSLDLPPLPEAGDIAPGAVETVASEFASFEQSSIPELRPEAHFEVNGASMELQPFAVEAPKSTSKARAEARRAGAERRRADRRAQDRSTSAARSRGRKSGRKSGSGGLLVEGMARHAYLVAFFVAALWAAVVVMFALGFQSNDWVFQFRPAQVVLLGLVAFLPGVLLLITAYSVRQSALLRLEAERARRATEEMVAPVVAAAAETSTVVDVVKAEIEKARLVAAEANEQLTTLRYALSEESERMAATVNEAGRAARHLTESLGHERLEMGILSAELDTRASAVANSIQRQAKMVAEASDLAQTQIREAEAGLAARAADLAAAAADAGELSGLAGQQLSLHADRLDTVGSTLSQGMSTLTSAMSRETDHMQAVSETLRRDQVEAAERLEAQRAQLIEAVAQARIGSQEIYSASGTSSESLRRLIADAASQVGALAEAARAEQEEMDAQSRARLKLFSTVVAEERAAIETDSRAAIEALLEAARTARESAGQEAKAFRDATVSGAREAIEELTRAAEEARKAAALQLEETRMTADAHTESSRAQLEQLSEAAFTAGQQADAIFDKRFEAARRLIEESTRLVEEAGLRSAAKIEVGLSATREALKDMEALLANVDARSSRLPVEAHASVEAVRAAVARGVDDLTAAARKAADETKEIDAAFQDRVRQNYEMLSQSVRLMTEVAGQAELAAVAQRDQVVLKPVEPVAPPEDMARAIEQARAEAVAAQAAEAAAVESRRAVAGGGMSSSSAERSVRFTPPSSHTGGEPPHNAELDDEAPLELGSPLGLRPRLRLTPTDQDKAVKSVFEPAAPAQRAAEPQEDWSWRDLLQNMDGPAQGSDDQQTGRLITEIEALGVDSGALLPRSRVEEIALALNAGDLDAGRAFVRRLAPAAVRRLARRMEMDPALRKDAGRFVSRFGDQVVETLARDSASAAALLSTDQGRTFLLLDAAVSQPN
jgi:hypothetical protein